jgi:hypothetical protein
MPRWTERRVVLFATVFGVNPVGDSGVGEWRRRWWWWTRKEFHTSTALSPSTRKGGGTVGRPRRLACVVRTGTAGGSAKVPEF